MTLSIRFTRQDGLVALAVVEHGRSIVLGRDMTETALKNARNYGRVDATSAGQTPASRWHQQFGVVIASCESADLRPLPNGVLIYDDHSRLLEPLPPPDFPRQEVLDEFCAAVLEGKRPVHDGAWGLGTMETCLAILQSHREGREIVLPQPSAGNARDGFRENHDC